MVKVLGSVTEDCLYLRQRCSVLPLLSGLCVDVEIDVVCTPPEDVLSVYRLDSGLVLSI